MNLASEKNNLCLFCCVNNVFFFYFGTYQLQHDIEHVTTIHNTTHFVTILHDFENEIPNPT